MSNQASTTKRSQLTQSKAGEFKLIDSFRLGYRNREEITKLPPGVLVAGSKNVITKTTGNVGVVQGYELDGPSSGVLAPIKRGFTWKTSKGEERNLRAGFLTGALGTNLITNGSFTGNANGWDLAEVVYNSNNVIYPADCDLNPTFIHQSGTGMEDGVYYTVSITASIPTGNTLVVSLGEPSEGSVWTDNYYTIEANGGVSTTYTFVLPCRYYVAGGYADDFYAKGHGVASDLVSQIVVDDVSVQGGSLGKLQFRNEAANGTVSWVDLITGLSSVDFNFADFWDFNTEKIALLLMANNTASIYEWSGATTTFGSATSTTITLGDPTVTWAERGFYTQGTKKVTINGTEYTYTAGESTATLTGVTPDPTLAGHTSGDLIFQTVRVTPVSSITNLGISTVAVIGTSLNQVYYGNLQRNDVYASKVNNYKDCSYSNPRIPGEGALFNLGAPIVGFAPQEGQMYMSAGLDQWYLNQFELSADLTKESLQIGQLKTGARQGAQSQSFITKDKNSVIFVSNEPTLSSLGRVENIYQTPQINDLSYPIINDMNSYDFTDGSAYYWKNFKLVAIPRHSLIRIYNTTDPTAHYWEAPIEYPVTGFYEVDGELYGHGYLTSESYKLFTGYNFNSHPMEVVALFSYQQAGVRAQTKRFDEFYQEGRCTQNGTLKTSMLYDTDGFMTETEYEMDGNSSYVAVADGQNSLGKYPLGKQPLGSDTDTLSSTPPKFRKIITMVPTSFYEFQPKFSSFDQDFAWELIAFGPAMQLTTEGNNDIKD